MVSDSRVSLRWDHHDGSLSSLAPRHGFTPKEVFAFHAVLGEARRTERQVQELVEMAIAALKRFDVWDAD